jgi:hypothetical protein
MPTAGCRSEVGRYGKVVADAVKRQHFAQPVVGDGPVGQLKRGSVDSKHSKRRRRRRMILAAIPPQDMQPAGNACRAESIDAEGRRTLCCGFDAYRHKVRPNSFRDVALPEAGIVLLCHPAVGMAELISDDGQGDPVHCPFARPPATVDDIPTELPWIMTIGVSHDPGTGNVVLIDAAAQKIYDFSPRKAEQLASQLRSAAVARGSILLVAKADDGGELKIGGTAEQAILMADDLDRNAELVRAGKRIR